MTSDQNRPASPADIPPGTPTADEKNWALAAHLAGFIAAYVALGVLGPTVVYFVKGGESSFIRAHAIEAINFNLTVLIGIIVSVILIALVVGIFMLMAIGVAYVVFSIMGALAARDGKLYRYPFTIRFVK